MNKVKSRYIENWCIMNRFLSIWSMSQFEQFDNLNNLPKLGSLIKMKFLIVKISNGQ